MSDESTNRKSDQRVIAPSPNANDPKSGQDRAGAPPHIKLIVNPYAPKVYPIPAPGEAGEPSLPFVAKGLEASHTEQGIVHHVLASIGLAIALGGAALTAGQPGPLEPSPVSISRVMTPPRAPGTGLIKPPHTAEGDAAREIREIVERVFEHYRNEATDEAKDQMFEALERMYKRILRRQERLSSEEGQEFQRIRGPDLQDGHSVFKRIWGLMRGIVCAAPSTDEQLHNRIEFCRQTTKLLQDIHVLSSTVALLAPLTGCALAHAWNIGIDKCCMEYQ